MKPAHKRLFTSLTTGFTVISMLINLLFPAISLLSASIAYAQDVTPDPAVTEAPPATEAVPPTDALTEPPAPPTETPTQEPVVEPTAEQPTTEPTIDQPLVEPTTQEPAVEPTVATEQPTVPPTEPPAMLTFQDNFQDGNADGWSLSAGWQVVTEADNSYLSALTPNETATIPNFTLEHFALSARVRIDAGSTANIAFRAGAESYIVSLDANGHVDLYRGGTLLASGPVFEPASEGTPAAWRTLNIQALGGTITVSVDGLLQIEYTDPAPLAAGAFMFGTGAANTSAVAFDDVLIIQLDAPVIVPTAEPTLAETTTITPEVTEEPTVTETPAATPAPTGTVILSANFEGELAGWLLGEGASVVTESDMNQALLMAAGSSLLPAEALYLADFQLDARLNLLTDAQDGQTSGASIFFRTQEGRTYVLSFEAGQTALSRNDGSGLVTLTSSATPHALNAWHTISLNAQGGRIVVTVNGAVEIDYTDATPLISGQIALVANASVMLDDIVVTDFTPVEMLAAPTMTPVGLTEESRLRMAGLLYNVLETYLNGDQTAAMALAADSHIEVLDDALRVNVVIWAAAGQTADGLVSFVEMVGGVVDGVTTENVTARVPLPSLVALVNLPEVAAISLPEIAVPTGTVRSPAEGSLNAPAGSVFSEGFNIIGANDWHAAGILGSGADVAVIDVDFNTGAGAGNPSAADRSCLTGGVSTASGYNGSVSTTGHGTRMVEIICDIAPSARVTGYQANDADSVANAIASADNTNEIIVIALDLGANASPGDGTNTGVSSSVASVYSNITTARNAGVLVIAAAGNNTGRYASFLHNAATTVNITARSNDIINVSWNGWSDSSDVGMSVTGTGISDTKLPRGSGTPSYQFIIPDIGECDNGATCTLDLTLPTASSRYVQVQVMDGSGATVAAITGVTGSTVDATAGNLARPADSANVLTVGAVCARPSLYYRLMDLSSRGPIFGAGGAAPVGPFDSRDNFKPDVVGPSDVTVSGTGFTLTGDGCDDFDTEGFAGTSAAAAHIAGMAALLRSASDTDITTAYPVNSGTLTTARQAIIDYMQSHTIDLADDPLTPLTQEQPNGFDMLYGAGLPVLGNPTPTYPIRPTVTTDVTTCSAGGPIVRVNPANLNDGNLFSSGTTLADGFVHPAYAIQQAAANSCIVLLPGEYITSIPVFGAQGAGYGSVNLGLALQSYDAAVGILDGNPASVFWVNDSYQGGGGGLQIRGHDIEVEGFDFLATNPRTSTSPVIFSQPRAIDILDSDGNVISNNSFANFGEIGSAAGRAPVNIVRGENTTVEFNTFTNNDATNGAALRIVSSNDDDVPGLTINSSVLVQRNTFTNNNSTGSIAGIFDPVIFIQNSLARIHNNRFTNNGAEEIIRISNTNDPTGAPFTGAYEVQVLGNLFLNNTNNSPVVHLDPSRRFRFINNTVVGHNAMIEANYRYVIARGNAPSNTNGFGEWDIFNNVFYNNASASLGLIADLAQQVSCDSVTTAGNDDTGARNNWYFNSGPTGGECVNSLAGNGNINSDPASAFIGSTLSPSDPYQLRGGTAGIDTGNTAGITGLLSTDLVGNQRISDGDGDLTADVDIGAYEFSPLLAVDIPNGPVVEDTVSVGLLLAGSGGFPPYTFEIQSFPANYSTVTSGPCLGQPVFFNPTPPPGVWLYCPPANFYTENGPPAGAPTEVTLTYRVRDAAGALSPNTATVTINITPTDDPVSPLNPNQNVLAEASSSFSFRLRPYVRFNNFRFSEPSIDTDTVTTGIQSPGADYGYTYSNCALQSGDDTIIVGGIGAICAAVNSAGGNNSVVNLTATSTTGFVTFTYDLTDSNNDGVPAETATGLTATITIVGNLPDAGLHDDTSFAFDYHGNWSPIYSEGNINNTLHRSATLNDYADFFFVGTGFAAYMQGYSAGGNWELRVVEGDGSTTTTFPWNGAKQVTSNGITCSTTQTTTGNFISNRTTLPYTVSCTGLLEDEVHIVRIVNQAALQLNVDAVGILEDGAPLQPGFHDVNEPQVSPLFLSGWTQINDTRATGGIAMSTTNASVPDVTFEFQGTGFAIGTILEKTTTGQGAQYDICVAPSATPANEVCQSFDNTLGATTTALWNVYRPFFGFDPTQEYTVTIDVTNITGGKRMVIDSIVVFNDFPTDNLDLGTTEDDRRGLMVFGGGMADNWTFDTNNIRTSNRSLTSIISTVPKAGPFVSFQIPDNADTINWFRYSSTTDSQNMLICVDRAQGDTAGTQATHCILRDSRTTGNPVVIRESDFNSGGGWGTAWGANTTHTVEIFSLTNQPFNMDKVQVIDSDDTASIELLAAGYYEEYVTGIRWFTELTGVYTPLAIGDDGNFSDLVQTSASGGKVKTINANVGSAGNGLNEGFFFQFNGTGFSVYFTLDRKADAVQACWLNSTFGAITGANIDTIFTTGDCQTWDNESITTRYQAARSVLGLPAGNYTVAVRMLPDQGQPDLHATTGSLAFYESPITMNVDAVAIYNDTLPGTILDATGQRYETSFVNRMANDTFLYYGTAWRSFSGRSYTRYSGSNYDNTINKIGAGVVFQTDNANTLILYRDLRAGYSRLEICVLRLSDGSRRCAIHDNTGGTGYQQPVNIPLFDATNHVVSIMTIDTGTFNLDAFELTNSAVLQPGLNQETHPGIAYSTTDGPTAPCAAPTPCPEYADWRDVLVSSYHSGRARQTNTDNATVTFQFTGTGFSLITLFDTSSATLVNVNVVGPITVNDTVSLNRTTITYGASYSLAGLPNGTYTVTLTEADPTTKHRMTVDAIEVYGNYDSNRVMSVGFYDNAQVNANGDTYLTLGPANNTWVTRTGTAASTSLNQTNFNTNRFGGVTYFQITGADAITLHHRSSTATSIEVCAALTAGGDVPTCETRTLVGATSNTFTTPFNNGVNAYNVSITNLSHALYLYVDGIGVHNTTGNLTEGMYQENHPQLTMEFINNTGDWLVGSVTDTIASDSAVRSTGTGNSGERLEFTFAGTGFAILLVESTLTSQDYDLCVDDDGTIDCDVINNTTLPNPPPISTAKRLIALTQVGLTNGTYTVRLTNNDATRPLLVDRVDILGDFTGNDIFDIDDNTTGNVENNDIRIHYFPYVSMVVSASASASGGSQHTGSMQGSMVFFELEGFNGGQFQYVRQTSTTYGISQICWDDYDATPGDDTCANMPNNLTTAFQTADTISGITAGTRWVSIRNTDGRIMTLDFIRPNDAALGDPLTAGYYEETYAATSPIFDFSVGFASVANTSASGGAVMSTTTVGDTALFQFNGTGFSVFFTLDTRADAIEICWVDSLTTDPATIIPGVGVTCQSYDNQSATVRYRAARTILGLAAGNHTAVVRMLADNNIPSPHITTALPITMQIDAVQIYDQDAASLLTPLDAVGTRYENSFVNASADNRFLYFGNGWSSTSGTAARLYSGSNYDRNLNVIGAGVVLRTNNADAIVIYRDTAASYQPLEVCAVGGAGRRCVTVPNNGGTGRSQPFGVLLNTAGNTGVHTVTITTLGYGTFILDAVEVVNTTTPLTEGMYEEYHPALLYSQDPVANFANVTSDWTPIHSSTYSGGRMMQTTALPANLTTPADNNGLMVFEFTGTGFEIGTLVDRYGGEVLVCYEAGAMPANPWDIDQFCYRYQHEAAVTRATVSRSVAGLTNGTYSVRIQNVSDAFSNLTATPVARVAPYTTARLRVDYVRIFDDTAPTITQPGWYNENAIDSVSGDPFLLLLPANRWASFTGNAAAAYTNRSYVGVVGTSTTVASNIYAGPLATLRVQVPAAGATVILYTGTGVSTNSDQILVCAENVTDDAPPPPANECVVRNIRTSNQIVVSSADLAALGIAGTVDLTYRALTTGYFRIDGFQVINGTTLTAGLYDNFLAGPDMVLDTNDTPGTWSVFNTSSAYNGGLSRTQNRDATMAFTFQGTGFSVITHNDIYSVDMRICYADTTGAGFDNSFATYPASATAETCEFIGAVQSFVGTNPNVTQITMSNGATTVPITIPDDAEIRGVIAVGTRVRILTTSVGGVATAREVVVVSTASAYRYGFAYYGLPSDTYRVEVRHVDNSTTTVNYLRVDAIAVFGNVPTVMNAGLYDDAVATITFAPEPFWTVMTGARFGPPRGPYQLTEHTASYAGSIAQLYINGNGFILYQTAQVRNSRTVRICLVVPGQPNECSDFSQNVARATYFTPIAFFGFGSGNHQVVVENRQHGTTNNMSIDGVRVLP